MKTTMSAEEVLQKFDKESDKRNLTGMWDKLISLSVLPSPIFQLYTATFGVLDAHLQRAIHLAFGIFFDLSAVSRQEKTGPDL